MIIWPWKFLKPQSISVDIAPRNLRSPAAGNGKMQVSSNSAGIWKASFPNIPVYTPDMIMVWRGISNQAEGMLNPIAIPVYEFERAPIPEGVSATDFLYNSASHSDGTTFSDLAPYESSLILIKTTSESLFSTVSVTVDKLCSSDLEPGHRFSVNHKLYEINRVIAQDDATATFIVRPPLRETIPSGTELNFNYPTLGVNLASDNEMFLPLNFNRQSFPTVNFIEAL